MCEIVWNHWGDDGIDKCTIIHGQAAMSACGAKQKCWKCGPVLEARSVFGEAGVTRMIAQGMTSDGDLQHVLFFLRKTRSV